jgi:general secretion pathway protein H
MPTSAPGSSPGDTPSSPPPPLRRGSRGFTLIELLIVVAIIALAAGLVALALPDGDAARLEEEGERLTALLEMARAEARVAGVAVRWVPRNDTDVGSDASGQPINFRFVGLPAAMALPTRWLDPRVSARVVGAATVLLGPEAILPAQRIVLRLDQRQLELASDGLGPFAAVPAGAAAADGAAPR